MVRLSRYMFRLFSSEALALFGVAAVLLFLVQCLRLFDLVSDKGQSLATLLGQALLGMPSLGIVFLYVCLGIGLGRALRTLQSNSELGVIHSNSLVGALMRGVWAFALAGAVCLLLLAHVVDPLAVRTSNNWNAGIAADLVSRSMIPHRFTDLSEGVSMVIGSRDAEGGITDFFLHDKRNPDTARTYFAKTAIITRDDKGFILRMQNGAIQYFYSDKRISQVAFTHYDLALDQLTATSDNIDPNAQLISLDLVQSQLGSKRWDPAVVQLLAKRTGEGVRSIAICLIIAAFAAFPTGRRRGFSVPIEITALALAFIERGMTSYLPVPGPIGTFSGSLVLIVVASIILVIRLRIFRPVRGRRGPKRQQPAEQFA